jgi:hypothetical protein
MRREPASDQEPTAWGQAVSLQRPTRACDPASSQSGPGCMRPTSRSRTEPRRRAQDVPLSWTQDRSTRPTSRPRLCQHYGSARPFPSEPLLLERYTRLLLQAQGAYRSKGRRCAVAWQSGCGRRHARRRRGREGGLKGRRRQRRRARHIVDPGSRKGTGSRVKH